MMKRLIEHLKRIRLSQVLGLCFAALFLVLTTACSGPSNAATPGGATGARTGSPAGSAYHGKDTTQNYMDLNERPARSAGEVGRRTEQLKRSAGGSRIDMRGDVGENTQRTLDRKGENLQQFGRNVQEGAKATGEKVSESAKDFQRGTERGIENLGRNVQRAAESTRNQAERVGENVSGAAQDAASATHDVQRATKNAVD